LDYGSLKAELESQNITQPSIKDISKAIVSIRQSKLPDPKEIGNSGSFFKNPIVNEETFNKIQDEFPNLPHYKIDTKSIKIPAGWLIENVGLKGYRKGDAGVHKKQALVLVNYGGSKWKRYSCSFQTGSKRSTKEI